MSGSSSRVVPLLRALSSTVLDRLAEWRKQRETLVMSQEWLAEHRWSSRDQY